MDEVEAILEHFGKKGMKWGVRRDKRTGVRPLARTLDKSTFGRAANANAQRSMNRSDARRDLSKSQTKRLGQSQRVASGKASVRDTIAVAGRQSVISLIRGKGLRGAAKNDAKGLQARQRNLKKGKGVAANVLRRHGPVLFNV